MTVLTYQATAPLNLDTSQVVISPDAAPGEAVHDSALHTDGH